MLAQRRSHCSKERAPSRHYAVMLTYGCAMPCLTATTTSATLKRPPRRQSSRTRSSGRWSCRNRIRPLRNWVRASVSSSCYETRTALALARCRLCSQGRAMGAGRTLSSPSSVSGGFQRVPVEVLPGIARYESSSASPFPSSFVSLCACTRRENCHTSQTLVRIECQDSFAAPEHQGSPPSSCSICGSLFFFKKCGVWREGPPLDAYGVAAQTTRTHPGGT